MFLFNHVACYGESNQQFRHSVITMLSQALCYLASTGKIKTHDLSIDTHPDLPRLCENLFPLLVQIWKEKHRLFAPTHSNIPVGENHHIMFRPSCRSSSPFSVKDFEMWNTESRFASQVRSCFFQKQVNQQVAVV